MFKECNNIRVFSTFMSVWHDDSRIFLILLLLVVHNLKASLFYVYDDSHVSKHPKSQAVSRSNEDILLKMGGLSNGQDVPLIEGQVKEKSAFYKKIASALFYGIASFMITVVNKTILTTYS